MTGKAFIIHPSIIIREGLYRVIRQLFDYEVRMVSDLDELENYQDLDSNRLIFLVDANIHENHFQKQAEKYKQKNELKIILIRDPHAPSQCLDNCTCCFDTDASEERIKYLLTPYFESKEKSGNKVSSGLTDREIDVVRLVAFGKTNKEIADDLHISIHTVISHRKNITEKLGIKSISGLTVYAILNNLIDANNIDPESLI